MRQKFIIVLWLVAAARLFGANVSGKWEFKARWLGDESYARVELQTEGEKLTGHLNEITLAGTVRGDELEFTGHRPNGDLFGTFKGRVAGGEMSGTAVWFGKEAVTWSARREPQRPAREAAVHNFEPKEFHRVFSNSIAPVLHLFPGDTVRTWTVDAGGRDAKGERRSPGGNPETGPFYIEGAFPGDTLAVKLNKVQLNRDTAGSGNRIAPAAVTAGYTLDNKYEDKFDSEWKLDRERGIATLAKPTERLKNYTVKLQPMLGCLAVAPPGHQSFRTGYLGDFGGNLDYNQMREGTTVYLPVLEPGALFFLGDGHAAQGDGELTGDALETSMDVEFTVDVIKGFATNSPRAENDDYLMSFGIAGSLNEALQRATSQLGNWLKRDYKLSPNEVAMVLGTAIKYDIAEVVDPQYHLVAKVSKAALAALK